MILVKNNQTFKEIDEKKIALLVDKFFIILKLSNCDVSVVFADSQESTKLNLKYRNKVGPANVLSFPTKELTPEMFPEPDEHGVCDLGDIIVCPEKVAADAVEWGVEFEENLERMVAHGLLHLLGYDHTNDEDHAIMTALEEKLTGRKIL